MVRGVVRPPTLELANRDLVEAHLHAVWLAESGAALQSDIPHILDLETNGLPVKEAIVEAFTEPDLAPRASRSMVRILMSIDAELTPTAAPWAKAREAFATATARDRTPTSVPDSARR